MKRLTFKGFLKQYVMALSEQHSSAIYPLTREAASSNPRLREPLFLFALSTERLPTLINASRGTCLFQEYSKMAEKYSYTDILEAFSNSLDLLPDNYQKIWRSYKSIASSYNRDIRVKELLRLKIIEMKSDKSISTYRICKDLKLNNANVNFWLKNGGNRVGLHTARSVMHYLENQ